MAQPENDMDSLARMVAEGFSSMQKHMDERFDGVDERLNKVEGRLDNVEKEVHQTNQRIDKVVMPMLDDHSRRIKDLETSAV